MKCALAHLGGCDGRIQSDHIIRRQTLRAEKGKQEVIARRRRMVSPGGYDISDLKLLTADLAMLIDDPRNQWPLCERGHHAPKDGKRGARSTFKVTRAMLPPAFEEFVTDYGLERVAEREIGPKEG